MVAPSRRTVVFTFTFAFTFAVLILACGRRDPNTPEGRAAIERERTHKEEAEERRRAKHDARDRDREERRRHAAETPPPVASTLPASSAGASLPTPGTCDASCVHYLTCKNAGASPDAQQRCVTECNKMRLTAQQLAGFERTDCASAIHIVENQGRSASVPSGGSSACNGCVWDGSSCIWLSQSNWGAGPYSGAYSSCDAACCRRR